MALHPYYQSLTNGTIYKAMESAEGKPGYEDKHPTEWAPSTRAAFLQSLKEQAEEVSPEPVRAAVQPASGVFDTPFVPDTPILAPAPALPPAPAQPGPESGFEPVDLSQEG